MQSLIIACSPTNCDNDVSVYLKKTSVTVEFSSGTIDRQSGKSSTINIPHLLHQQELTII